MKSSHSILTNLAFHESATWSDAVTSICQSGETPDSLPPLLQACRLLKRRAASDVVVTMGPRPSLAYGILCGLLCLPSKQIMTEVFLDEANPKSLPWRIKTALFRWIAKRSLGILTNSSAEIDYISRRFEIPTQKLRFVPMHTTIAQPERVTQNDGVVLSIGRTLRDLDTLLEAAPQFGAPVVLILGKDDPLPATLPDSVRVLRELPLDEVHEQLRQAAVVVIPLRPAERSTGQVVLFEAMAFGKPVIATRATGITDYIRDGENGRLVEPGNAPALAHAVQQLLKHPMEANRLANQALADCKSQWSPDQHAAHKLDAIASLLTSVPPSPSPEGSP